MFAKADVAEDACTTIGVPPEASENGHTLLAQNWDWWSMGYGTTVLLEVEQKPFAKAIIITEAGLVGGKGLNECGIALSMNAMSVKKGKLGVRFKSFYVVPYLAERFPKLLMQSLKPIEPGAPAWVSQEPTVCFFSLSTLQMT